MEIGRIKQLYPNIEDYSVLKFDGLTHSESLLLGLHNAGDLSLLQSKLWHGREISDEEKCFILHFEKALAKLERAGTMKLYRYEISLNSHEINKLKDKLKKCLEFKKAFSNLGFWNFSIDNWEEDTLRIEVETSSNSRARLVYLLYGEIGESENEVIFPINTQFEVMSFSESFVSLKEL